MSILPIFGIASANVIADEHQSTVADPRGRYPGTPYGPKCL